VLLLVVDHRVAGWMRERTGSLVAPVLSHNAFNVAQSFV
jgi:membrane protease YdiL (CAAX protease family)